MARSVMAQPQNLSSLLNWIYRTPETRRPFKDDLSDWILDRHATGEMMTAKEVLERLRTTAPDVAERAETLMLVHMSTSHNPVQRG